MIFAAPIVRLNDPKRRSKLDLETGLEAKGGAAFTLTLTAGCFDLFHAGHLDALTYAAGQRREGSEHGFLVVGVNSDDSVRALKGDKRPYQTFGERAATIAALRVVDLVAEMHDPTELIHRVRPDYYVKGRGYVASELPERWAIAEIGGEVVIAPTIRETSTTQTVQLIETMAVNQAVHQIPITRKVWGTEYHVTNTEAYTAKVMDVRAGYACSVHRHQGKDETFHVTAGIGCIARAMVRGIPTERTPWEVWAVRPGDVVRIPPNHFHCFWSVDGMRMTEVSTRDDQADVERVWTSGPIKGATGWHAFLFKLPRARVSKEGGESADG